MGEEHKPVTGQNKNCIANLCISWGEAKRFYLLFYSQSLEMVS